MWESNGNLNRLDRGLTFFDTKVFRNLQESQTGGWAEQDQLEKHVNTSEQWQPMVQ